MCCGYSLEAPRSANEYTQHMFFFCFFCGGGGGGGGGYYLDNPIIDLGL